MLSKTTSIKNTRIVKSKTKSVRRILVAVDGSACSTRALAFALVRACENRGSSITVLNVQPLIPASGRVPRAMVDEHVARQSAEDLRPAKKILKRCTLPVEVSIQTGDPATRIMETLQSRRCSEVILGNSGRGILSGLLLGSVAAKVIQLAECPVTVVK